eukprot:GHVR01068980.1.p1 GENE.GHVR01068980.1~~GHVR01068980.1.p1  ORF type:complete len:150 (+),score=33.80 GHVR01068980.1:547-996(+)
MNIQASSLLIFASNKTDNYVKLYLGDFSSALKIDTLLDKNIISRKNINLDIMPPSVNVLTTTGSIKVDKKFDYFSYGIILAEFCYGVKSKCTRGDCTEMLTELETKQKNNCFDDTTNIFVKLVVCVRVCVHVCVYVYVCVFLYVTYDFT